MANDIGISIRNYLVEQSGVTSLCAQRGFPDVLPKDAVLPAFTLQVISESPHHHMGGSSGVRECRLQIDCYAFTRREANLLDEAILAAIDMQRGTLGGTFCNTVQAQERISGEDAPIDNSDQWRYIAIRDYLIWYVP